MDFIEELGYLAVASRMKRLTDRFMRGGLQAYKSLGIDFEPRWFTVFYLLHTQDSPLSISEIASSLKISHPAVIQTTQKLIGKGLIRSLPDAKDRRVRRLEITGKGKELVKSLIPFWDDFVTATSELFEKAGVNMLDIVKQIEILLDEEDIGSRIVSRIKHRQYNSVEILDYSPEFNRYFQSLNYEWLERYFKVEELDKKILKNPEKEIIDQGGFVLFARLEGEIVGTTAVLRKDENTFEIAKMAVSEKAQGRQVGKKLTEQVIARAASKGARELFLRTDNRLRAAINLYRSFGFRVTHTEPVTGEKYEREKFGIQMKLDLSQEEL